MILLSSFLLALQNNRSEVLLILIVWFIVVIAYFTIDFYSRRRYYNKIKTALDDLDQKYLLAEIIIPPQRYEDLQFYHILKATNRSMLEHITAIKHNRLEYKDYIESWIHEIKTPISAITLLCENNKSTLTKKIHSELLKIDNYTEQALFYARSEHVEKDYLIREVSLADCINQAIIYNKLSLIQNQIKVTNSNCETSVYSDSKWLVFIITQIVVNAIKYKKKVDPYLKFTTETSRNSIALHIEDNGIGIAQSELNRIFEKGFTGSNGRKRDNSTGIGLYLSRKLCHKLGLSICAQSELNQFTRITITFPKDTFLSVL
jgi:signal transduction histidine kinase